MYICLYICVSVCVCVCLRVDMYKPPSLLHGTEECVSAAQAGATVDNIVSHT